jgi:hypothetical protein
VLFLEEKGRHPPCYKKPADDEEEEPEPMEPKSVLTLDQEELQSLIEFLRQNYEPFRRCGVAKSEALQRRRLGGLGCAGPTC